MRKTILGILLSLLFFSCSKGDVTVASIVYDANDEWFREAIAGMQEAAGKYHVNFKNFDCRYDLDSEFSIAKELVNQKIDSVVLCPINYEKSAVSAKYLLSHNIPVVTWNNVVDAAVQSRVVVDSKELGKNIGKYLKQYFEENHIQHMNLAIVSNYDYETARNRCNGFKDEISSLVKDGRIKVYPELPCELVEETKSKITSMIAKSPEIQIIFCWNQMTLAACLETLSEIQRKDILVCGVDLSRDLAHEMLKKDSNLIAVVSQQPYKMGYTAMENAIIAYSGKSLETKVEIPIHTYTREDSDSLKKYIDDFKIN